MKRLLIAGIFLLIGATLAQAQYPPRCAGPCGRYSAFARGAGAMGSMGQLQALYRQCTACINSRGTTQRKRRPRCKKGEVSRGKYCMPKGSSQCPKKRSKHCAAPNICATNLAGEDSCFTKDGLKELKAAKKQRVKERKAAKDKQVLETRIASRAARESRLRQSFQKRHGVNYAKWLEKLRQLATILQKIQAGDIKQIDKARADLQEIFTPPSTTALPPPVDSGLERLKTGKNSKRCERNFDLSELWDNGFKMDRCTSRGWVIAKRKSGTPALAECVALHPDGSLMISLKQSEDLAEKKKSPHFAAEMTLRGLKADSWLLGENDRATLRISVDGSDVYDQTEKVGVSTKPPLRYSFLTKAKKADLDALAAGSKVAAQIGDQTWGIDLRGSAKAIKDVKYCAYVTSTGQKKVNYATGAGQKKKSKRRKKRTRAQMCQSCGMPKTSCDRRCVRQWASKSFNQYKHNMMISCFTGCGAYKRLNICAKKYCK